MASIINEAKGRKRIDFFDATGKRRSVRLGKASIDTAREVSGRIVAIVSSKINGAALDPSHVKWIADLDEKLHRKLAAVQLVAPRAQNKSTAVGFLDGYLERNPKLKPRTLANFAQLRRLLEEFFGAREINGITVADAQDFRAYMAKPRKRRTKGEAKGLGENTIRRHTGRCYQLWRNALSRGVVRGVNPFDGDGMEKKVGASSKDRDYFLSRVNAYKVIDACPDIEWKLIVALTRFGGLRCPSEHLKLKWTDITWEPGTILVHSPKTEHHEGKETRLIPLFPELRALLMEALEQAEEGATHVITRYRTGNSNLRSQLERIIVKAGLKPWPKLFHNMRATRETELNETFPVHVVCEWIGNDARIAQKHYLRTQDSHFTAAVGDVSENPQQNPQHHTHTGERAESQSTLDANVKTLVLPSDASVCASVRSESYPQGGLNISYILLEN